MMKKSAFLFCLLFSVLILAQEQKEIDKICIKTVVETSAQSMPKALKIADSLYNSSNNPLTKAKSLLLLASLNKQTGNLKKSLYFAEKAKLQITQTSDIDFDFRVTGYLATQYRIVGLYEKSYDYVLQAKDILRKMHNQNNFNQAETLLNQEMAYHEIYKKRYSYAIKYAQASITGLKKIKSNRNIHYTDFVLANAYELIAESYYQLGDYTTSEMYYNKAKHLLKTQSFLLGFVYNGLGAISLEKNNLEEAKKSLDSAEYLVKGSNNKELKKSLYLNFSKYYEKVGKEKISSEYYKKHIEVSDQINLEIQQFVNDSYNQLDKSNQQHNRENLIKSFIIIFLLLVCICFYVIFNKKQKKQYKRFTEIIELSKINHAEKTLVAENDLVTENTQIAKKSQSPMSSETELKLLKQLDEFEKSSLFNEKNMSLSNLSAKLNTNSRYLSYVINKHKDEEFKTYINRLRVNYIIHKLTTDSKYRLYKISTLAEECGFSSHSKFTAIFKNFTGLSPSLFIKYLEKETEAEF